jgi:hypothetical protein
MNWSSEARIKAMAYHRVMTSGERDGLVSSVAPASWLALRELLAHRGG